MFRNILRRFSKTLPIAVLSLSVCLAVMLGLILRQQQQHAAEDTFAQLARRLTGGTQQLFAGVHDALSNLASAMHRQPRLERFPNATFWRLVSRIRFGPAAFRVGSVLFPGRLVLLDSEEEREEAERCGLNGSRIRSAAHGFTEAPAKGRYTVIWDDTLQEAIGVDVEEGYGHVVRDAVATGQVRSFFLHNLFVYRNRYYIGFVAPITRDPPELYDESNFTAGCTKAAAFTIISAQAALELMLSEDAEHVHAQIRAPASRISFLRLHPDAAATGRQDEETGGSMTLAEVRPPGALQTHMTREARFVVGDAELTVVFTPSDEWLAKHIWLWPVMIAMPLLLLLFGVVSSLLLALIIYQFRVIDRERGFAEMALSSRNKFLAYLCHELRNPLNATKGLLEWLRETELSQQQEEYVGSLEVGFQHMSRIMNDTLDLGKLEAGCVHLERAEFDLCEQLLITVKMHTAAAGLKGLRLIVKVCRQLPRFVFGDPTRLTQIISNLISNALKFTMRGHVALLVRMVQPHFPEAREIELLSRRLLPLGSDATKLHAGRLQSWPLHEAASALAQDGAAARRSPSTRSSSGSNGSVVSREIRSGVLEIQVLDTGSGISAEALPSLFLPYSQPVPTVEGTGTGLGLSFVKGLVCCWGGDVTVRSQRGVGTAFIVRLPLWFRAGQPRDESLAMALQGRLVNAPRMLSTVLMPGIQGTTPNATVQGAELPPSPSRPFFATAFPQQAPAAAQTAKSPCVASSSAATAGHNQGTQTVEGGEGKPEAPLPSPLLPTVAQEERGAGVLPVRLWSSSQQRLIDTATAGAAGSPCAVIRRRGSETNRVDLESGANAAAWGAGRECSPGVLSRVSSPLPPLTRPFPLSASPSCSSLPSTPPRASLPSPSLASYAPAVHISVSMDGVSAAGATRQRPQQQQHGRASLRISPERRTSEGQLVELGQPRGKEERPEQQQQQRQQEQAQAGPVVLVVDDSSINRSIVCRKLQRLGCVVLTANNGREALRVVAANPSAIQLILMDIQMPVMDGHQASTELRKQGCQIPVIALTGSVTDEERQRCKRSGMKDFLPKPLEHDKLVAIIDRYTSLNR